MPAMLTIERIAALLTRQERLALILRYVDRLRLREIGQLLHMDPVFVGLLLLSIRRRVRASLKSTCNPMFFYGIGWVSRHIVPAKSAPPAQAELPPYDPAAYPVFWHGSD